MRLASLWSGLCQGCSSRGRVFPHRGQRLSPPDPQLRLQQALPRLRGRHHPTVSPPQAGLRPEVEEAARAGAPRGGQEEEWEVSSCCFQQSDCDTLTLSTRYERDMATMVRVIREFLKIPETTFSTQEIQDVCGILNVNAHEVLRERSCPDTT